MIHRTSVLALLAWSLPAAAQQVPAEQGFDAHGFQLAAFDGDIRDPLYLHRPGRMTAGEWFLGGLLEYANAPLVKVTENQAGELTTQPALDHLVSLNLSGGVAVHHRLRFDVALPVHFASFDLDGGYQGALLGDLRATAMIAILRPDGSDEGPGLGVSLHLDAPTGAPGRFLGQRSVAGGGRVNFTYGLGRLTFSSELGLQFNPAIELDNLINADQLIAGVGIGYTLNDRMGLTFEGRTLPALSGSSVIGTQTPTELALSYRYRAPSGGHLLAGVAAGLPRGAGAARARVFIGGGFGKVVRTDLTDEDGDGIFGEVDACPERPETVNGWADEDGCPDSLAQLGVDARFDGKGISGATVVLRDGSEQQQTFVTDAGKRVLEVMPSSDWRGQASIDCVAGQSKITVGEGRSDLVIEMSPVRDNEVHFVVTDTEGNPVPGVSVRWQTERLGCVPEEVLALAEDGTGEQQLGLGEHVMVVEAPGYRIHRESVTLDGTAYILEIVLEPTKIKMVDQQILILEKVFFETDSDVIKDVSFGLLDEVATTILAYPRIGMVEVQGHTDSRGDDAYNLDLSQRRADSVRAYLMDHGVPGARLQAMGYGEARPVADNRNSSGREKNRRVEFQIVGTPEPEQDEPEESPAE